MVVFNKPKIEIAEISEDKKYGEIRSGTIGKRLWNNPWQFPEKNYAFFFAGCGSEPGKD